MLVEYAVNDQPGMEFEGDQRKGFERLLRKLLNYPKKPAVILVNSFAYMHTGEWRGPLLFRGGGGTRRALAGAAAGDSLACKAMCSAESSGRPAGWALC